VRRRRGLNVSTLKAASNVLLVGFMVLTTDRLEETDINSCLERLALYGSSENHVLQEGYPMTRNWVADDHATYRVCISSYEHVRNQIIILDGARFNTVSLPGSNVISSVVENFR
jgi:hypothetical protein